MIIWYKNSVLASLLSIVGCLAALSAGYDLVGGEGQLSVPVAIAVIVVGVVLIVLGKLVSVKKEEKALRETLQPASPAAQPRQSAAQPARPAVQPQQYAAQPQPPVRPAVQYQQPVPAQKKVGFSAIAAGVMFLLAGILSISGFLVLGAGVSISTLVEFAGFVMLAVGCFISFANQKAGVLHLIGFAVVAAVFALETYYTYQVFGFESVYDSTGALHGGMTLVPLITSAALLLMAILSIFALVAKGGAAVIVKIFWILPALALAAVTVKRFVDYDVFYVIANFASLGDMSATFYAVAEPMYRLCMNLAVLFAGWAFMRICGKPSAANARPAPVYTAPASNAPAYAAPVNEVPAQPAPAEPEAMNAAPAREPDAETEKKIAAYRDLLECGILTREEYDQKISELKRG